MRPSPPHPTPVHSPSPCQPAPSWLGVPTAAGGPEVRGAAGLSGLVCEHLWERHPGEGPHKLGCIQGGRGAGCYLFVIRYKQTFHEDGPGTSCLGTAPHIPSVFLPPQITTSARTWPVRMVSV